MSPGANSHLVATRTKQREREMRGGATMEGAERVDVDT